VTPKNKRHYALRNKSGNVFHMMYGAQELQTQHDCTLNKVTAKLPQLQTVVLKFP